MKTLTQELVREIFDYSSDTGIVTHRTKKVKAKIGDRAGSSSKTQSRYLRVLGKKELEHRIIWLYTFGYLPIGEIDHINHDRTDNRLCNLREVTHHSNMKNKPKYTSNSTGTTGVSIDKRCGKYRAYLSVDGKPKGLGYFDSYDAAVLARTTALQGAGYHANHGH